MRSFKLQKSELEIQPLERSDTIPSDWYIAPEMLELEREHVFAKSWQLVGRESDVMKEGEHITSEIAGEPLVIVRGKDGALRGFYNVCRHRGGPLATENGCSSVLQCKYHGWTYSLDGSLRGVPDFDRVELFDRSDFGLVPVRIDIWDGFIFATLDNDAHPLSDLIKGIIERIAPIQLRNLQFHSRITYEVQCNWKTYVDNFLEGYHVPLVHPELFKIYDFNRYTTEIYDEYSLQHSPLSGEENIYSSGEGEAFYYFIWPNLMLNILPGRLQTNLVVPVAAEKTLVHFDYFYAPGTSASAIEQDLKFSHEVQHEDIHICELVQRGLRSRSYDKGRFSVKREAGVHHFQTLLKKALASNS